MNQVTTFQNSEDAGLGYTGETWLIEDTQQLRSFRVPTDADSGDLVCGGFGLPSPNLFSKIIVTVNRTCDQPGRLKDLRIRLASDGDFHNENKAKPATWGQGQSSDAYTFTDVADVDLASLAVCIAVSGISPDGVVTTCGIESVSVTAE